MAKTTVAPIVQTTDAGRALQGEDFEALPIKDFSTTDLTSGMHTRMPRTKRPEGSSLEIINGRVRRGWVGRRGGTAPFGTKPDSDPVLHITTAFGEDDRNWLLRITQNEIHGMQSFPSWELFAGTGFPLGALTRIDSTQYVGKVYLASLQEKIIAVSFGSKAYEIVTEAPKAKFCVAFADRIVAANVDDVIDGSVGTRVEWSANGDPFDWTSESAGKANLDSAPGDSGDEITGLHVVGNVLIILRERSVWKATRQPIASAPFRFEPVVTQLGCDLPYGSQSIPGGVIFPSRGNQGIFRWQLGGTIESISSPIGTDFLLDLAETEWVDSTYDPFEDEYHFGIATIPAEIDEMGLIDKVWVFAQTTSAWTFDTGPQISTLATAQAVGDSVLIDELIGDIDDQVADASDATKPNPLGWIDNWAADDVFLPTIFKGTFDGEVLQQTIQIADDYDPSLPVGTGLQFEFLWMSQDLGSFSNRRTLKRLMTRSLAVIGGKATFEFANEELAWSKQKTASLRHGVITHRYGAPRIQQSGNDLYFRVRTTAPTFRMFEQWFTLLEKGRQFQLG
jgi:hypothetical protein